MSTQPVSNIIIGTAGHVDHGKTCLIRALTGIDTDRLQEEKKRGITIELGFAYLDLPDGRRAGIIDVPGHEKFIRNMLAGAGGIDIAMLVVAADEGVMPQTVEHLGILSLLGISQGVIVITKADAVDPDWLELVREDVCERVRGTFLEGAPVAVVSAYTGQGIEQLRALLFELIQKGAGKNLEAPFRIPVDRVFSMEGFGTVITGTLIEGMLHEGEEIMVYPAGRTTRARGLQVHSRPTETAYAGQRVAVNLAGLKKGDVDRGSVLAPRGLLPVSMMADVRLRLLPGTERSVKNGSRLHFYHGSREVLCKTVLLDAEEVGQGGQCFAQLRFEEDVSLKAGDRFVVRFYSPLETVGGGVVLDPCPLKHKRFDEQALSDLRVKETGGQAERLEVLVREHSAGFETAGFYAPIAGCRPEQAEQLLSGLEQQGKILRIGGGRVVHAEYARALRRRALDILTEFHAQQPLKGGMRREELRSRLLPRAEIAQVDALIDFFIASRAVKEVGGLISVQSFKVELGEELEKLTAELRELYRKAAFAPPATDEVLEKYKKVRRCDQVLSAMISDGTLVRLDAQIYMDAECVNRAREIFREAAAKNGSVTLGEFRDLLGTSRKFAVALLEQFDRQKFTKKVGDARVLA